MKISEYIQRQADLMISNSLERYKAGHNGPYRDPETKVRNISHWLMIMCYVWKKIGSEKYLDEANKLVDYLCSDVARPMNATYFCRMNRKKDFSNGLMGQAWVLESLIEAKNSIGREDAYKIAHEVFSLHEFNDEKSIWNRVNVDGSNHSADPTFNHQLWFASVGAMLDNNIINDQVDKFINNVIKNVDLYKNGIIYHASKLGRYQFLKTNTIHRVKNIYKYIEGVKNKKNMYSKSVGYHSFNLYAFAMLMKYRPNNEFWQSSKLKKMLDVINTEEYKKGLDLSIYSWGYNPPGIEIAYTIETFLDNKPIAQKWIDKQIERTYCKKGKNIMIKDVPDEATSAARLYEATRLKHDYDINI